jgi:flagellar biosynthetic protein FlhB
MADTEQEKTEAATPKRREEALKEGQVPRSQELTTALLLLGAALSLQMLTPALGATMLEVFGYGLSNAGTALDATSAARLLQTLGWRVLAALGALLAAMAGTAVAVGALQARGIVTGKSLAPKWGKLNPLENLKRMLGVQPWAELAKSLLKLTIIGIAVYAALGAAWEDVLALSQQSPIGFVHVVQRYGLRLLVTAGSCYLVLAALDYVYQLWQFEKNIRMTKEEIKQEHKQSDGDPMVKARMRSVARQLARRQMFKDVPTADVVIANPTHIAIALRYDPTIAPAPIVVAMGRRKVAERIKQIAFEHGVPVMENRPLARALIASAAVGQLIPHELYSAVAEILAFVIRQRAALGRRW